MTTVTSEVERLAAVHRYDVLDAPADGSFDRITAVAASIFAVPIAIVSIVDTDRIWLRSHHGIDVDSLDRQPGLCSSAIMSNEPYILEDARLDPVALTNPLVAGEFGLRFYAAAPLTTHDGHNLGTLCILDKTPRSLSAAQVDMLRQLAGLVVDELELRLSARAMVGWESELRRQAEADRMLAQRLADALQRTLLPPRLPDIAGIDLAARFRPAGSADVGGDFFDVFPLPRRAWGIAVGDVCGKGPSAASITTAARYAVRAAAIEHPEPAQVLRLVNEALLLDDEDDGMRFCTMVYGRLRAQGDGYRLTVASGGHPLPLLRRRGLRVEPLGAYGTAVGLVSEVDFVDRSVRLRAGDCVVFFTDGLTELRMGDDLFGSERVVAALAAAGGSAEQVIDAIEEAIVASQGHQTDDIAIVALVVREPPDEVSSDRGPAPISSPDDGGRVQEGCGLATWGTDPA